MSEFMWMLVGGLSTMAGLLGGTLAASWLNRRDIEAQADEIERPWWREALNARDEMKTAVSRKVRT